MPTNVLRASVYCVSVQLAQMRPSHGQAFFKLNRENDDWYISQHSGNHTTLFAKSLLDGITAIVFASTFGSGVILSALPVLIYQGAITAGASLLKPFLTGDVIAQMAGVGGLLIAAIGGNILQLTRFKVGNMLPAIFLPIVYHLALRLF